MSHVNEPTKLPCPHGKGACRGRIWDPGLDNTFGSLAIKRCPSAIEMKLMASVASRKRANLIASHQRGSALRTRIPATSTPAYDTMLHNTLRMQQPHFIDHNHEPCTLLHWSTTSMCCKLCHQPAAACTRQLCCDKD